MKSKRLAMAAMVLAFTAGSAFTSMAATAGFRSTSQGTKYQWGSGDYCVNNWVQYRDHWFYFGSDGVMRTGWIQRDGTWYFAAETGELQAGLLKINGNVYYMNNKCKLVQGDLYVNHQTYHFTDYGTNNGQPYVYQEWNSNGTIKRGYDFSVR